LQGRQVENLTPVVLVEKMVLSITDKEPIIMIL